MRGTLYILVLVAVVAVGLWYWQTRSETRGTPEPLTASSAEDSRTADASTAQATDPGVVTREGVSEAADSGTAPASGAAETPGQATAETAGQATAETPGSDTAASTDTVRSGDSDGAGTTRQAAGLGEADRSGTGGPVLSPVPESTVEWTPVDAPPEEASGETDVLAAVDRFVDRVETAVKEHLLAAPETGSDAESHVPIENDDSQSDTAMRGQDGADTDPSTTGPLRAADSDATAATETGRTTESVAASSPDATRAAGSDATEAEARQRVETLTATTPTTTPVDEADHFVTQEHARSTVPEDSIESVTVGALSRDETLTADTPVAVVREVEQIETAAPEQLIADSGGDPDQPLRVQVTYDDSQGGGASESGATEAEARQHVETLTATTPTTIPVDEADHFVTQEHVLSMVPEDSIESVTVGALSRDETLTADTPITVVREVEQIETAAPEQLIADSGGDLDQPLRVQVTYDDSQGGGASESDATDRDPAGKNTDTRQEGVEQITVREALERLATDPGEPLSIIKTVRYFEVMTLRELLDREVDEDAFLDVVTQPYRIESATLADLLQRRKAENPDSIFYLHTVQPGDEQGIWGIVHYGLIENFARGMAIRRGENVETYTIRIPRHADERLDDRSSSFLGKLIDRKTKDSFVYNYREHRMGRNPDRIYPGQEIVIIDFEPEELRAIYKHFAAS